MSYNLEKLIDILTILAKNNQELTKLRINKLLYFIDREHLRKYGKMVLGDKYFSLDYGPIPSLTYNLICSFCETQNKQNRLSAFFRAGKNRKNYDKLELKKESDGNSLSESEKNVIKDILRKYGSLKDYQLVNKTHKDSTWVNTKNPKEIDTNLFLEGLPKDRKKAILELIKIENGYDEAFVELNQ